MKSMIFGFVMMVGFSASAESAMPICFTLQNSGYMSTAAECAQVVNGVSYDHAVVILAQDFIGSGYISTTIDLLKNTKGKIYTGEEVQLCMNYYTSGYISSALSCMKNNGSSAPPVPTPTCPVTPNYKGLLAMVQTVESDLIANTPDSRTDAFKNLENLRAILAPFAQ